MSKSLQLGRGVLAKDLVVPDHHAEGAEHPRGHDVEEAQGYWDVENVELTTVGIDVGSSTSHLMFARVHLQRMAQSLSSRFVVVSREVLWRSPVVLTPYLPDNSIDAEVLGSFVAGAYRDAELARAQVDTGAVILTGEALKRRNAQAIAALFAEEGGRFVCASAGHHLEAVMAAHGSGAAALSRTSGTCVLNVDIGGGTSKLALCDQGEVVSTAAVAVGGRLVARDGRRLVRIEGPAHQVADACGLRLELGSALSESAEAALVDALAGVLSDLIRGGDGGTLGKALMVTEPLVRARRPELLTFSGGVAEYIYGREPEDFGDLALKLAAQLRAAAESDGFGLEVREPPAGIRATVIGASQFSVQVSGNTVELSDESVLPVQNLPVLHSGMQLGDEVDSKAIAQDIRAAAVRFGVEHGSHPVALSLRWSGEPLYARLRALADGIAQGLSTHVDAGQPLVVLVDGDIGRSLGSILRRDIGVTVPVVCLDGLVLQELDYVDIGDLIRPSGVVPLVIKSLLFTASGEEAATSEILLQEPPAPTPTTG